MSALPKTSIHYAYALVRRGGNTVGKRPSCRMAWLVGVAETRNCAVVSYHARIGNLDCTGFSKTNRTVKAADIVQQWRFDRPPSLAKVKAEKAKLSVVAA